MNWIADFHFLRPAWLLLLAPALWLGWRTLRRADSAGGWRGVMAPRLLEALALEAGQTRGRLRPPHLLIAALALGSVALAGPAWERQPTPFAQDQAAVFLVVKVTPSMLAQDIPPNRLERGVQKLGDFLDLKAGQRAGLIAYAGTAHLAMPLTSDPDVIRTFAGALDPAVMPVEGADAVAAVRLADERLDRAGVPGSVVLLADDVDPEQVEGLRELRAAGGAAVHVLALAAGLAVVPPPGSPPAPPLDEDRLRAAARAGGGDLVLVTPDDQDIRSLAAGVERGIRDAPTGEGERWRDMGWWLLPLLALLLLPFFRRGGAVVVE